MLDLATAPLADIIADNRKRKAIEPKPPLADKRAMFERLAEFANNAPADRQDLITDIVNALTPHLSTEDSALWWYDLKSQLIELGQAGDEEESDGRRWPVERAADRLAGA